MIGTGITLLSLGLVGLSLVRHLAPAVACCVLVGFGLILFFSTSQAVVQLSADDHNRGRIMGIWAMILSGATPLGTLIAGPAADRWGTAPVLLLQGASAAPPRWVCLSCFAIGMRDRRAEPCRARLRRSSRWTCRCRPFILATKSPSLNSGEFSYPGPAFPGSPPCACAAARLLSVACLLVLAVPVRGADNELTEAEKNEGYVLLFNGKDLKGWHRTSDGFGGWHAAEAPSAWVRRAA